MVSRSRTKVLSMLPMPIYSTEEVTHCHCCCVMVICVCKAKPRQAICLRLDAIVFARHSCSSGSKYETMTEVMLEQ